MKLFVLSMILCAFAITDGSVFAQRFTSSGEPSTKPQQVSGDENARRAFVAYKAGDIDLARKFLAAAKSSDAYAMYVKAALDPDAVEAADMFKEIVAENHGRPIAGEALLKLYKYHYAIGDYSSARVDYLALKKYPDADEVQDPAGLVDSVKTTAPTNPAPRSANPPVVKVTPPTSVKYIVQVGVFTSSENAHRFIDQLRDQGVEGTVFTKDGGGRPLYGVSAGSYATREAAESYAQKLKNKMINCIVVEM